MVASSAPFARFLLFCFLNLDCIIHINMTTLMLRMVLIVFGVVAIEVVPGVLAVAAMVVVPGAIPVIVIIVVVMAMNLLPAYVVVVMPVEAVAGGNNTSWARLIDRVHRTAAIAMALSEIAGTAVALAVATGPFGCILWFCSQLASNCGLISPLKLQLGIIFSF